ncbi:MAG TPA: EAL domain-containing protein, partial [Gemmatimonadaceae bacterium]|nr:EAL domain-containing protein [Gemmatimonadaceae bacterium]
MRLIPLVLVLLAGVAAVWWMQRSRAQLRLRIAVEAEARRKLEELQAQLLKRTVELEDANEHLEREVMERRKMEEALRESEERYALAARGANDGLWDWNLIAGEVYLSERWREMVGVVDRSLSLSPEEWFSRVHLSDLPQLKVDIAAQAAGSRSHFHSEHRLRHSEGFFIWVLCRGIVVRDGEGRALRIAGSMTDITARKDLEERLRREAQFDSLTTLPNRSYATDLLRRAIARAKRNKEQQFGVLFLDCDRFKVVNDSLGHHAGDSLLRLVAGRLNGCVRPGDVVARLGGDEFVVILEGVKDEAEAISVAERIQHSLAQPFYLDGRELFMSVSVGIAMSQPGLERPEDYLRDADLAMYRAKLRGRARHEVFRADMRAGAVLQMSLENDLRHSMDRGELRVMYQPVWSLGPGRIVGFEALVRWDHPTHGAMQPADFIPIAEETGLILPLGEWVLRQSAQRLAHWNTKVVADDPIWMSVNVAARQLTHPGLVEVVKSAIAETGIDAGKLKLEITESMIMADAVAAVGALEQLKALGIHMLMDDFGTGHASLSYLHRLPISTIKIDRYFVGRIDSNSECLEIVRTILNLSRSLSMDVVAEGVENSAQREVLQSLGCEYVQGYLLSPPLDADAAERLLLTNR